MTNHKTTVGIVGAGRIASEVHLPVLRAMPTVDLVWITDINGQRAKMIADANRLKTADPSRPLPSADIVLLAVPLPPRRQYFEALAVTESTVFAEKPLASSANEHRALLAAFPAWRLAVGYQRRMYATSRFVRSILRDLTFGKPKEIRVREGDRMTRAGDYGGFQDISAAQGGGITLNLGCHSLDYAVWAFGAQSCDIDRKTIAWDGDTDRKATADIVLHRAAGDSCLLRWTVSWLDHQPNTIEIDFDNATLVVPIAPSHTVTLSTRDGTRLGTIDTSMNGGALTINQAFYLEWKDVIDGHHAQVASAIHAESSLLAAGLMDSLLER